MKELYFERNIINLRPILMEIEFAMKLTAIASAVLFTLPLSFSLSSTTKADELTQPCRASLDASGEVDRESNNCPLHKRNFSIIGTFANEDWQASLSQWEPGYYILYLKNKRNGTTFNLAGFDVGGTTSRPQYRFDDRDSHGTFIVTFRYSDANIIRLETFYKNHPLENELLTRTSNRVLGGP